MVVLVSIYSPRPFHFLIMSEKNYSVISVIVFRLMTVTVTITVASSFLDASTHLYKRLCPSVRPSVGRSVGRLVGPW